MEGKNPNENKSGGIFMMICDIMFVMVLCFVVLLATMMAQKASGGVDTTTGYVINPVTLAIVAGSMIAYVVFLVKKGKAGLKATIDGAYAAKEAEEGK